MVDCQHEVLDSLLLKILSTLITVIIFFLPMEGLETAVVFRETHTVVPRGAAGVDESTCIILYRDRWMRV